MKLYLAPMAGITNWPFRRLCYEHGCDAATTEMISAQGYLTAPKDRAVYRYLSARAPFEGTLIVQLFGSEPLYMARAASELTKTGRFAGIDINMGCPAQKVTGGGAGSALMKNEKLAGQIIGAVVGATLLPVTVKMRLGWDDRTKNALSIARIAQEEGAAAVTVHGRTRMQQYGGKADWQAIADIKRCLSIPVIANGDVTDGETALRIAGETNCDGIAIGRGALGNPWVFDEIKAALCGEKYEAPALCEIVETAKRHALYMIAWKGEKCALQEMRKYFAWYVHGRPGAASVRAKINTAPSFNIVFGYLDEFLAQNRDETGTISEIGENYCPN